jgi:hypothetical protein
MKRTTTTREMRRTAPVFRVDYPDGYVEDTGMMSLRKGQYYCLTLCYRSITTGELKQLKLCSLQRRPASSSSCEVAMT